MNAIANQNTFRLQYEKKPRILRSFSQLSSHAKDVYTYLYNIYINSTTLKSDNTGQYLTVSRKAIGAAIGKSIKSVIGYIVELVKCGLIKDRRMGVKEINRIYFIEVDEQYKYDKKQETEETSPEESEEQKGLIKKVKEIITPLEIINSKVAKRLLMICRGDLDLLSKAAEYTSGKPYNDLLAYISTVVRNKHYEVPEPKPPSSESNTKPKVRNKSGGNSKPPNTTFSKTENHGFDIELLQKREELFVALKYGDMSQEEYDKKMADLE